MALILSRLISIIIGGHNANMGKGSLKKEVISATWKKLGLLDKYKIPDDILPTEYFYNKDGQITYSPLSVDAYDFVQKDLTGDINFKQILHQRDALFGGGGHPRGQGSLGRGHGVGLVRVAAAQLTPERHDLRRHRARAHLSNVRREVGRERAAEEAERARVPRGK